MAGLNDFEEKKIPSPSRDLNRKPSRPQQGAILATPVLQTGRNNNE